MCDRFGYPTSYRTCNDHGICFDSLDVCLCENDWGSLGDFAVSPGFDCDQHGPSIRALGIILTVGAWLMAIYGAVVVYVRLKTQKYNGWRDALLIQPISCALMWILHGVYGLLKYIDFQKYSIGNDSGLTALITTGLFFFQSSVIMLIVLLGKFFAGYTRVMSSDASASINSIYSIYNRYLPALYAYAAVVSFLPLVICGLPSDAFRIGVACLLGNAFLWLVELCVVLHSLRIIKRELSPHAKSGGQEGLSIVYLRVRLLDLTLWSLCPSIIVAWTAFGVWEYLQRKAVYMLLVSFLSCVPICGGTVFIFAPRGMLNALCGIEVQSAVVVSSSITLNHKKTPTNGSSSASNSFSMNTTAIQKKIVPVENDVISVDVGSANAGRIPGLEATTQDIMDTASHTAVTIE